MSNLGDKENIFNNYGRFYFPKDFYKYKEKKESNVDSLDELLNELKVKLKDLEEKLDGIEIRVDIQPLIERIDALELIASILENDNLENETRISFLETTKLDKTDFEEYKDLIESFKSQISLDVSDNKELFDLFKTKVENDLIEISTILLEMVTTSELEESLEQLKEEILINIPTGFDPTEINRAISNLQLELSEIKVDNTFNKESIETINSEILKLKQQIQELDISELTLKIKTIEIKVSDLETSVISLLPVKDELESLKIKLEKMEVKLEGIDFDLFTESLEDINKTVDVLKLHDLFDYWLNLPENMIKNSQGLLEINTLLTLQDFITYLLNDKDYSQKFSEIESLVSELSGKIDLISFEIEGIDLASINEEIVKIKNELQEIETLKGDIQALTILFESNNEALNTRIETLSGDITELSNIVASFLDTFYTKQETDLLLSPITSELLELTESLSEYYNKVEVDSLLEQIRESIVSSTGVSVEYLEEQLYPINLKLSELESLIESATTVDLTTIEQNISNLQTEVFQLKTNTYTKKQVDDLIAFYIGTGDGNYILRPATDLLLGGVKVGSGLTYLEDGTINVEFPEVEEYILPEATETVLGGIRIGGGLKKVGGKLAVDVDSLNIPVAYELPTATTESIGGVIIGDTLEVDENGKIEVKPSAVYELPIATTETIGGIKVGENLTITEDGVLSATGGGEGTGDIVPATSTTLGGVKVGNTLNVTADGTLNLSDYVEKTVSAFNFIVKDTGHAYSRMDLTPSRASFTFKSGQFGVEKNVFVLGTDFLSINLSTASGGGRGHLNISNNVFSLSNNLEYLINASTRRLGLGLRGKHLEIYEGNIDIGKTHTTNINVGVSGATTTTINGSTIIEDLNVTGEKNAIVPTRKGMLKTPAYETMGTYLGDLGKEKINEGYTTVLLNELFLDSTEDTKDYHVFLSVYSDASVYVYELNNDSFTLFSDKETIVSYEVKRKRRGFSEDYVLTEHKYTEMKELFPTEKDILEAEQERLREEQATLEEPAIEDIQ